MLFDPGFNIQPTSDPLGFSYGDDCFGPRVEQRKLDDIRQSLRDPSSLGPHIVYAIAMDVGSLKDRALLQKMMLLYGVVTYAAGRMGDEPVRSQGHIHRVSAHSGWSPPEVYEIWSGRAIIYMQEYAKDDPGRCFAVYAGPGDVIVVPPGWAHATISTDPQSPLTFGAWCDREYGFLYDDVRARKGLAWYPLINADGEMEWKANPNYQSSLLQVKSPGNYEGTLQIIAGVPIYTQFKTDPERFRFVAEPALKKAVWENFIP